MAKIIPNDLIKGITGKVCGHSDLYYSMNKTSGKVHTGKCCNPYEGPLTDKQLAQQNKFAQQSKATAAWLRENRPNPEVEGDRGTELYRHVQTLKKGLGMSSITQVLKQFMDKTDYSISIPGFPKWVYKAEEDTADNTQGGSGTQAGAGTQSGSGSQGSGTQTPGSNSGYDDDFSIPGE